MTARTPAILGGPAAFPDHLHLLRPTLPSFADLEPRLRELYTSGMLTKGPILADYERLLAEHLGVRHALGVSSCTAGLMLVFDRFRGADVVLPSFTFMATAMAAVWAGLRPVFADIDPETWCLSPAAAEAAITPDTALVVPVHLFGDPADTEAFDDLGRAPRPVHRLRRGARLRRPARRRAGRPRGPGSGVQHVADEAAHHRRGRSRRDRRRRARRARRRRSRVRQPGHLRPVVRRLQRPPARSERAAGPEPVSRCSTARPRGATPSRPSTATCSVSFRASAFSASAHRTGRRSRTSRCASGRPSSA